MTFVLGARNQVCRWSTFMFTALIEILDDFGVALTRRSVFVQALQAFATVSHGMFPPRHRMVTVTLWFYYVWHLPDKLRSGGSVKWGHSHIIQVIH